MANSWVYVIGMPDPASGPVKIGYTATGVTQRLAALRATGDGVIMPASINRSALELLYHVEAERWMERALHSRFHNLRVCGEWFALRPAVARREVKMAIAEISRDAERRQIQQGVKTPRARPQVGAGMPELPDAAQHHRLFRRWVESGFTEDQALRMVAMMAAEETARVSTTLRMPLDQMQ
jgi:hypothetical protein